MFVTRSLRIFRPCARPISLLGTNQYRSYAKGPNKPPPPPQSPNKPPQSSQAPSSPRTSQPQESTLRWTLQDLEKPGPERPRQVTLINGNVYWLEPLPEIGHVKVSGSVGKLASLLFQFSSGIGSLAEVQRKLHLFSAILQHPQMFPHIYLVTSGQDPATRMHNLAIFLKHINETIEPLGAEVEYSIQILVYKNKLAQYPKLLAYFDKMCAAAKGILEVTLITSKEISPQALEEHKANVEKNFGEVIFKHKINKDIEGGFIIMCGEDRMIDLTERTKRVFYEKELKAAKEEFWNSNPSAAQVREYLKVYQRPADI